MSESQSVSRSRLELARAKVDRVFGDGQAAAHPELVIAVVNAASSDWAESRLAVAIERVAEALLVEDEPVPQNGPGIVRAHRVMRP
jgi:hypothetical protein